MEKELKRSLLSSQVDLSRFTPASEEEKAQQDVMGTPSTFFKDGMKKLMRNPLAVGSIIVLVLLIVTIIVAPMIVPYGYEEIIKVDGRRDKTAANLSPFTYSQNELAYMEETGEQLFPHIFGTDRLCRDYFARVIYGTRVSLSVGLFASILVMVIGVLYGAVDDHAGKHLFHPAGPARFCKPLFDGPAGDAPVLQPLQRPDRQGGVPVLIDRRGVQADLNIFIIPRAHGKINLFILKMQGCGV